MEEDTRYSELLMKNIRKILMDYKISHRMTNLQMAMTCEISLSEYEKIMNKKRHGSRGCYATTVYKIHKNLGIEYDDMFNF